MTRETAAKLAVSAYVKATIVMAGQPDTLFQRAIGVFQSLWNTEYRTMFGAAPFGELTIDGRYGTNTANALFWLLAASTGASANVGAQWASAAKTKSTLLSWSQRNTSVLGMGPEVSLYTTIVTKLREPSQPANLVRDAVRAAQVSFILANSQEPIRDATSSTTVTTSSNVSQQVPQVSVVSAQAQAQNAIAAAGDTRKLQDIEAERNGITLPSMHYTNLDPVSIQGRRLAQGSGIPTSVYVVGGGALLFAVGYGLMRLKARR